jgi:hypothetical protein
MRQFWYNVEMEKRAMTAKEKKDVMKRLYKLWLQNPELRLAQLIENVYHHAGPDHCIFHKEDFDFIEELENHYKKQ